MEGVNSPRTPPTMRKKSAFRSIPTETAIDKWSQIASKIDSSDAAINSEDIEAELSAETFNKLKGLLKEIETTNWMYDN
jgi:hypothetical protein